MKVLNLIIKQKYFDSIMAGQKVQEFREVKPTTIKKLLKLDDEGYEILDEHGNSQPIEYDAIRFFVGYNKDRDSALVEVKDAYTEIFVDDKDEPIEFEVLDEQTGRVEYWVAQQVVYNLGKILETDIKSETKKRRV
jgi:hypothetical protein